MQRGFLFSFGFLEFSELFSQPPSSPGVRQLEDGGKAVPTPAADAVAPWSTVSEAISKTAVQMHSDSAQLCRAAQEPSDVST